MPILILTLARRLSERKTLRFAILLLCIPALAFGQTSPSPAPPPAGGNPLLAQTIAQLGWASGRAYGGVIAQGTLSRLDDQGQEVDSTAVTIEVRADHRFRMELGSGDVTVVSDARASIQRSGAARSQTMLPHVAVSLAAPYFPFLTDVAAAGDPEVQLVKTSVATIKGEDATGIAMRRAFLPSAQFRPARESSSAVTLWISQKTGLPLRMDFVRLATDNWNLPIPFSVYYSDWQLISGVLVPMQVDEGTDAKTFLRYKFSSVIFNQNIPDSDFVGSGAGGTN